ncbi:MAG: YbaB/EbfC family nucleoid-associated protein [Bacteroidota bacterium]
MIDISKMMGKLKEVQDKMKEVQENLKNITASAESGGGMVKATANGQKQIIKLEIDDALVSKDDKEMLSDLVVAAVNKSLAEVEEKSKAEMQKQTNGMMPNIPGFDFSNLG